MLRTDADFWKALLKRSGDREAHETLAQETEALLQTISYAQPLGSLVVKRILANWVTARTAGFGRLLSQYSCQQHRIMFCWGLYSGA